MKNALIIPALLILVIAVSAEPKKEWTKEEAKIEFKYAEELRKLGLNEFADKVIAKIPPDQMPPELKQALRLVQFQTYLRKHRDDEKQIQAYIKKEAGDNGELYWTMKIRWADDLWARGKKKECLEIYESFMQFYDELLKRTNEKPIPTRKGSKEVIG
jgi:hypothetical protein